jgi:ComF family protein
VRCGDAIDAVQYSMAAEGFAQCRTCRLAPPQFVKAVSFGTYQGRLKEAIHLFKYDRLYAVAPRLGDMLASAIGQLAAEAPIEMLVVPVPLHKSKHAQRGFNQARVLATHALKSLGKTHPEWRLTLAASSLVRLRATQSQAGLTPRMRRMNVRGAFKVSDPAAVSKRHVLVIDDILTTGATARAVSKALLDAEAASVWVATLARARRINDIGVEIYQEQQEFTGSINAGASQDVSRFSSHDHPSF